MKKSMMMAALVAAVSDPAGFDADQLCAVAKSWGARQILLVAKHVGGFNSAHKKK